MTARSRPAGTTRATVLRRAAVLGGAVVGGGLLAGGLPGAATSAPSAAQDRRILNLVLLLEQIESAFYGQAKDIAALSGELREYVSVVEPHEREHVAALTELLGSAARRPPRLEFGTATTERDAFVRAAVRLEDLVISAYNGQAANLTADGLAAAARIVSVEARHAGWIRGIAGERPAPDATDRPLTEDEVLRALRDTGWVR